MAPKKISIRIDGELVNAVEGQTILEAAKANHKYIPTLCYLDGLKAVGACRICIVEVSGIDRLFPACTTPMQEGMSVTTNSPKLTRYRRITVELLFVERNHVCAVCVSNGHCELQSMATALGITTVRFAYNFPTSAHRHVAPTLRARSQPLHSVHTLCASLRRNRGRTCLGSHFARHSRPGCQRAEREMGTRHHLHQLRQVRAGLPYRRAGRKRQGRGGDGEEDRRRHLPGTPQRSARMKKVKVATVWLDGCSGCHMSLLDMDAGIIPMARKIDLVYGPLVDAQEFPEDVDVTLVEGAVSSQDDLNKIQKIRQRTKILVSLGDCAVTGNVPAMRNSIPVQKLLQRIYIDGAEEGNVVPSERVPALLKQARPLREFVKVDLCLPGCPPPSKAIFSVINDLLDGKKPDAALKVKFG